MRQVDEHYLIIVNQKSIGSNNKNKISIDKDVLDFVIPTYKQIDIVNDSDSSYLNNLICYPKLGEEYDVVIGIDFKLSKFLKDEIKETDTDIEFISISKYMGKYIKV